MKKTSRVSILAGLVILLLIVVGGTFYYLLQGKERAVKTLAQEYATALKKADYQQMVTYLDPESIKKNNYTVQTVTEKYQTIFSAIDSHDIKVSDVNVEKDGKQYQLTYQVSMNTMFGKLEKLDYHTTITNDGDTPKIQWAPDLIFPEMEGQDKVSIEEDPVGRGDIVDRNNQPLATTRAYQQLGLNPSQLGEGKEKEANLKAISKMFAVDMKQLEQSLEPAWATGDVFVPIKVLYDKEEVTPLDALPTGAVLSKINKRYYPLKEAAAHLIGYVSQVTAEDLEKNPTLNEQSVIGKTGLEATFDKELRGEDGGAILITDEAGQPKATVIEKKRKDPETIKLTIDAEAQKIAFANLADKPGSSVVMQPETGDVLVATSSPSYDPNQMMLGMSQKEYDQYANDAQLPFMARFTNRYAPGSTFKVITAAIGLDNGTIDPEKNVEIDGLKWQKDPSWGDYEVTRVKDASPINLEKALAYSDNIYFAQQALAMGEDKLRAGLKPFIFGEDLKLPLAMDPASISNEKQFKSDILLADTGYGQGELLIAPLQQVAMYSTIANKGTLVYPRLTETQETEQKKQVISADAAQMILDDLVHTVEDEDGYVRELYQPDFVLAAKTGTAELKEKQDEEGAENSFLLYFDKDHRQFMGITMIENSQDNGSAVSHSGEIVNYLEEQ